MIKTEEKKKMEIRKEAILRVVEVTPKEVEIAIPAKRITRMIMKVKAYLYYSYHTVDCNYYYFDVYIMLVQISICGFKM